MKEIGGYIELDKYCLSMLHEDSIKLNCGINDWIYIVNFYGQLSNQYLLELKSIYSNLIADNAHAYFQMPLQDVDTIYTCRKFFGVADGAILYTESLLNEEITQDESHDRM